MDVEIFGYKISPYSNNTCWQIQQKQTKENAKAEWKDPHYYPSTFSYAIQKVRELVYMDSKKKAKSLDEAIDEMKRIDKEFEKLLENINIK